MSRKTKFSNNWKKAKTKVTKCHQKIGNIRCGKCGSAGAQRQGQVGPQPVDSRSGLVRVPPADNRQTQARFACIECGFEENADLVGAINILAAGHAVLACGGRVQSDRPAKQESAEATRQGVALV